MSIDLGLFSSKSLVECNADHRVEIRDQRRQMPYVNVDRSDRRVWHCESSRSQTTIAKYAEYQVNSFKMAVEMIKAADEVKTKTSESDSNSSAVSQPDSNGGVAGAGQITTRHPRYYFYLFFLILASINQ